MLVDEQGNPPTPYTLIEAADVEAGRWRLNEAAVGSLEAPPDGPPGHPSLPVVPLG